MDSNTFDLIVLGSGPAGEKAAVKAAYFGYKVALVEEAGLYGGAGVHTGTLPSKTLKETALFLSGKADRGLYGINRGLERDLSIEDFLYRKNILAKAEGEEVENNLKRHGVIIFQGHGSFHDPHTILLSPSGAMITGKYILIATGSYPYHPQNIPFSTKDVYDSDTILKIDRLPSSLCVLGAGVIGCEYATIFSTMGSKVILINDKSQLLPFIDQEITQNLIERMKVDGIELLINSTVKTVTGKQSASDMIQIELENGKSFETDMFLFAAGRQGNTKGLNAEKMGIKVNSRGLIEVDARFNTAINHIFAVGDVIGYPALASTSMDQGRVAVGHIFGTEDLDHVALVYPYGIYTIPEISQVGVTEEEAQSQHLDYLVGRTLYPSTWRGMIMGVHSGLLKIIFSRVDLKVLGISVVGRMATELIHYGMELVLNQTTLYEIIGRVFNCPTLHELYKYAAYDGLSALTGKKIKP